jgi:hypothetical protein
LDTDKEESGGKRFLPLDFKEIADNALNAGGTVRYGFVDAQAKCYFIQDNGPAPSARALAEGYSES